jgi:hypothetical protein
MFWGFRVNENGESNIKELMQLFGDVDIRSCVRISQLNWTGHVNRMDCKRKVRYLTIILKEMD